MNGLAIVFGFSLIICLAVLLWWNTPSGKKWLADL